MSENEANANSEAKAKADPTANQENSTFDVSEEIKKLQEQAEKYKNDYLYLRAEFDNYRRHVIKERSDLTKYGAEYLVRDLLGVLDNFERALHVKATSENINTYVQGIQLTATELKNVLSKHGVTEVPSEGVAFDPNIHEALTSEPTDRMEPGFVLRCFQKAYKLHEKIIRPAQVVVAKAKE